MTTEDTFHQKGTSQQWYNLCPSRTKKKKSITRQVNLAVISPPATTEYLHWSEQPIEFNREDHPITVPRPGNAPLVLKAEIGAYDVDRIFMDAGSEINLIYAKTLRVMHISLEFLKPTDCSFHGIVPGSANYPLGRIALNICFGNQQNYRREKLDFEVMDWPSQYHAILGRPVFFCDSWQCLTIHIWYSKCQDQKE
jgi:hypothetical protein